MITLSNGHTFKYMVASGALGFDAKGWPWEWPLRWMGLLDPSLFTVVVKTLTREPKKGNLRWYKPWDCIKLIRDDLGNIVGTANAIGLTNPGVDWWREKIGPKINSKKIPVVGSIFGDLIELMEMAEGLNKFDLVALEINASCPNTIKGVLFNTKDIIYGCQAVKKASRFPLILKLSVANDVKTIVRETEDIVEAYSINSVPWRYIFPNKKSPLEKFGGGGVSGKPAQQLNWELTQALAEMTLVPIIAPGIWDFEDINRVKSLGADAISFGSVFTLYPWRPTIFVRRMERMRESKKQVWFS
jgi:dihydroorotate dehydrogenase